MFLRGACSRPSSASFVHRPLLFPTGKTDILSDPEQTYTLVIHKTLWIRGWITALFNVRRFLITPHARKTASLLSRVGPLDARLGTTVMRTPKH
jgi:hypothetical protein